MKHREIAAVLFAVAAGVSIASAQVSAPNSGSAAAGTATAGTATADAGTPPPMRPSREAAADADARLCLEFPTNEQVIMCAEKYRPHRRKA